MKKYVLCVIGKKKFDKEDQIKNDQTKDSGTWHIISGTGEVLKNNQTWCIYITMKKACRSGKLLQRQLCF